MYQISEIIAGRLGQEILAPCSASQALIHYTAALRIFVIYIQTDKILPIMYSLCRPYDPCLHC